jgi:hypothetical protein
VRRLKSKPGRTIAGAALAAVMTGIVVNAMLLQRSHRVQPMESSAALSAPAKTQAAAPPPAAVSPNANAEAATAPATPPARPTDLGSLIEATTPGPHSSDPIRDLLRGDSGGKDGDAKHLTITAQNALVKLGYSIKADGVVGASTLQAIEQFERSRSLPVASEITPKLVKQLTAAANATGH